MLGLHWTSMANEQMLTWNVHIIIGFNGGVFNSIHFFKVFFARQLFSWKKAALTKCLFTLLLNFFFLFLFFWMTYCSGLSVSTGYNGLISRGRICAIMIGLLPNVECWLFLPSHNTVLVHKKKSKQQRIMNMFILF